MATKPIRFLETSKAKNICHNKQITILQFHYVIYKLASEILARCCYHAPTPIPLLHSTEKFPRLCFCLYQTCIPQCLFRKKKRCFQLDSVQPAVLLWGKGDTMSADIILLFKVRKLSPEVLRLFCETVDMIKDTFVCSATRT